MKSPREPLHQPAPVQKVQMRAQQKHTGVPRTEKLASASSAGPAFSFFKVPVLPREPSSGEVRTAAAEGISGSGQRLPHLDSIQRSFGSEYDLSAVSAHVGGAAADASRKMGAEAYAFGEHVAFGSAPSLHTAAHEAAHVIQQRSGLPQGEGANSERHADAVADSVVRGQSAAPVLGSLQARSPGAPAAAVQMKRWKTRLSDIYRALNIDQRGAGDELQRYMETLSDADAQTLSNGASLTTAERTGTTQAKNLTRSQKLLAAIRLRMKPEALHKTLPPASLEDHDPEEFAQKTKDSRALYNAKSWGLEEIGAAPITQYTMTSQGFVPQREEKSYVLYHPKAEITLYHVTKPEYVNSIRESQLNPGRGGSSGAVGTMGDYNAPGYIYLTNTPENARGIGANFYGNDAELAVLACRVDTNTILVMDPDMATTAMRTVRPIPGSNISLHRLALGPDWADAPAAIDKVEWKRKRKEQKQAQQAEKEKRKQL